MITLRFELHAKDWSVLSGSPFFVKSEHVPRAGEVIDVAGMNIVHRGEVATFMVVDVTHYFDRGALVPSIKCHQCAHADRPLELAGHGWVPFTHHG